MARTPSRSSAGSSPAPTRAPQRGKGPAQTKGDPARGDGPSRKPAARPASKSAEGWLYGRHPVEAALLNPQRQCHRLMATKDALASLDSLLRGLRRPIPVEVVPRQDIDDLLGPQAVHQGLALKTGPLPALTPEDLVEMARDQDNAVVMVLDQVTDPHNVGAVLRSATAFGALAVVVQDRHSPDETGVLAKSASGALEKMPLVRVANLARALDILKDGGFWVAGLAADGRQTIRGANLSGKIALCLGSEGEGLRRLTRDHCDHLVRLPMMPGAVESLNVSNAAAVALYALREQVLEQTQ